MKSLFFTILIFFLSCTSGSDREVSVYPFTGIIYRGNITAVNEQKITVVSGQFVVTTQGDYGNLLGTTRINNESCKSSGIIKADGTFEIHFFGTNNSGRMWGFKAVNQKPDHK